TAECQQVTTCLMNACDAPLKQAFGAGYATGEVGGDCVAWYTCVANGGCTQAAGQSCISQATPTCQSELQAVQNCVGGSCAAEKQACINSLSMSASVSASTGGGTACMSLVACCQQLPQGSPEQQQCAGEASSNIDAICQSVLMEYQAQNLCN